MSCLFNSLRRLLENERNFSKTSVRTEICDFMETNLSESIDGEEIKEWIKISNIDEQLASDPKSYIEKMRNPGQWGGGIEIAMASKLYNVIIKIRDSYSNDIIATFDCGPQKINKKQIVLRYTGTHFEPSFETPI
jgi:hypothetical protein